MAKKNPFAEPVWDWDESIAPAEMEWRWVRALHWYRCNADPKKKKAWVLQYVKEQMKGEKVANYRNAKNSLYEDAGGLCRIALTGCKNDVLDLKISESLAAIKEDCAKQNSRPVVAKKPTISIQQRIADQVSEYMDTVNLEIDKVISYPKMPKKTWWDIRRWMERKKIKSMQATEIMKEIRGMLNEARAAYQKEDEQLVEAYSYMKPTYLHKYVSFLEHLVESAEKHISAVKPKTKVNRQVDPEKIVKKLPYMKVGKETKVKSEHPKKIIGADALFVYNETSRLLCVYQSRLGNGGLTVKGASIDHFDPDRSFMKKVRSVDQTINIVKRLTKKHILEEVEKIKTVKKPVRPRLNANCVIVRVI
jgi:hypothetical protein